MFTLEYNQYSTKRIILKFNCPNCNNLVEDEIEDIPYPDFTAEKETHSATSNCNSADLICQKCNKEFEISLCSSICSGELYSGDLPEDTEYEIKDVEDEYYDEFSEIIRSNTSYFSTFEKQMKNVKILIDSSNIFDKTIAETINKLVFSNIITCLETYLSDSLINNVLENKIYLVNFVTNYKEYKDKKISFNDICTEYNKLEETIKKDLLDLVYHNLPKIKGIYESTFNIKFPQISEIMKKIDKRHDIVHRNGKTKEDDTFIIDKAELEECYKLVYSFVENIDNQIIT